MFGCYCTNYKKIIRVSDSLSYILYLVSYIFFKFQFLCLLRQADNRKTDSQNFAASALWALAALLWSFRGWNYSWVTKLFKVLSAR